MRYPMALVSRKHEWRPSLHSEPNEPKRHTAIYVACMAVVIVALLIGWLGLGWTFWVWLWT
jgi:hypothetical protein